MCDSPGVNWHATPTTGRITQGTLVAARLHMGSHQQRNAHGGWVLTNYVLVGFTQASYDGSWPLASKSSRTSRVPCGAHCLCVWPSFDCTQCSALSVQQQLARQPNFHIMHSILVLAQWAIKVSSSFCCLTTTMRSNRSASKNTVLAQLPRPSQPGYMTVLAHNAQQPPVT